MVIPEIKQYGLHRSGTNFLRVILQENYRVTVFSNEGGWKHGHYELPQRLGRELDCVVCVKDPYAWLVSLHRYRHPARNVAFPDFVRSPIKVVGPDGEAHAIESPNPVRLWGEMHQHWLSVKLRSHQMFVFNYEKVLARPEQSVQDLVEALGLERKLTLSFRLRKFTRLGSPRPRFYVPPRQLGALRDHYRKKNLAAGEKFNSNYYQGREYLMHFDASLMGFVNDCLDADLVRRLGYEILQPQEIPTRAAQ